jgi:hypothetical protein
VSGWHSNEGWRVKERKTNPIEELKLQWSEELGEFLSPDVQHSLAGTLPTLFLVNVPRE